MTRLAGLAALPLVALCAIAARAAETTVRQVGQAFDRSSITLKVGDHVRFTNEDEVKHDILIQSGDDEDGRDMGLQRPGETLDVPFDKAGRFRVRCHIHPGMKLGVTVD